MTVDQRKKGGYSLKKWPEGAYEGDTPYIFYMTIYVGKNLQGWIREPIMSGPCKFSNYLEGNYWKVIVQGKHRFAGKKMVLKRVMFKK